MQLKEFFFKIRFLYAFIPIRFLMQLAGKKVILPFYHFIDDGTTNFVKHLYTPKTKKQFIEDLNFFKKHFESLSVKSITTTQKSHKKNGFLLSFDDGLFNFYHTVAPILIKEKVFAINFLNSNFLDNKDLFYRYKVNLIIDKILQNNLSINKKRGINNVLNFKNFNTSKALKKLKKLTINNTKQLDELAKILEISFSDFLEKEKPYLTEKQVLGLMKQGFFIGAHSKNHPRYALLPLQEQLKETTESVDFVAKKFGVNAPYFAFPFSDDGVSNKFFTTIKSKEIITFGSSGLKDEVLENHFQRIPMEYNTIYTAKTIVKGELVYYILKRFFGFHKTKRS